MEIDWSLTRDLFRDCVLAAVGIYTWWCNREKVTARRFEALEKDVARRVTDEALRTLNKERDDDCAAHEARTQKMEMDLARIGSELRHMPSHNDLARLHGRIDEMHGALREQNGLVKGIGHQVNLILEEMMKR